MKFGIQQHIWNLMTVADQKWKKLNSKWWAAAILKNVFVPYLRVRLLDFSEILPGEAVFSQIFGIRMRQIPAFHRTYFLFSQCSLYFGDRRLSYRLRYTVHSTLRSTPLPWLQCSSTLNRQSYEGTLPVAAFLRRNAARRNAATGSVPS